MCGANPCDKPNCTWSREHLQACEARMVAKMPAEWRRDFYAEVLQKRGPAALAELKKRVGEAWKKNQQQPSLL
jgi:hypothetical protein